MPFLRRNLPGILWTALIVLLMGIPGNRFPEFASFWDQLKPDKLIHVFLFGVWAYLVLHQNRKQFNRNPYRFLFTVLLLGTIISALTETLQHYVFINRSGSLFDGLANLTGMIFGIIIYLAAHRKKSVQP